MQPARIDQTPKAAKRVVGNSHWHLNLIRRTGEDRVALLNGKLVNVGGRIEGALVTAIGVRQVTLKLADDRLIKLELPSVRLRNASN